MFQKKVPPAVHWYEGMFLQPHHFQQFAARTEDLLSYKAFSLSPHHWGVERLELDHDAIAAGRFVVTAVEAVFPDGLVLQNHLLASPLERDLESVKERLHDGDVVPVTLAVPDPMEKAVEVSEGEDVGHALRYKVQPAVEVPDHSTGTNESPVSFLRIKAQLLIGDEDPTGFQTIPIAHLVYEGGVFQVNDYLPPTICVGRESPIANSVRELCKLVRAKAAEAAGGFDAAVRHQRQDPRLENRLRAFGLVGSLLPLEQMVETDGFRPVDIYLALCRMLGELSTLKYELEIPGPAPGYEHGHLRRTFSELIRRIEIALDEGVDNYDRLEMRGSDGKFEVLNLRPEHLDREIFFAVRGGARSEADALGRWVDNNCIIASGDQVRDFIRYRILGIEREVVHPHPIDLQLERGTLLYRLKLNEESRQALQGNQQLFFVRAGDDPPGHERPRLIEVYVRKETTAS